MARATQKIGPRLGATRGTVAFLVGLYLAWVSAGAHPFGEAIRGAIAPMDLTRDFVAAKFLADGQPLSTLDGTRGNAEAVLVGAAPVRILGRSPFHLHPPPASLPMRLLVPLGYRGASVAWFGLSVLLVGVLARMLLSTGTSLGSASPLPVWALFALLILWPPVLTNLQLGQWSIVLAALIAVGFRAWDEGRPRRGAAWMALAAALKTTPLLLFPFLALRHRRAAAAFVGVLVGANLLALPLGGGMDAWMAFRRDAGINVEAWQTWWHNTLSINGLVARLLVGGRFARPLVYAPGVARVVLVVASLTLGLTALAASRTRPGETPDRARDGCAFAAWNILVVVLNPLAWTHCAILLLLPATLVLRAADAAQSSVPAPTRCRLRVAAAVALVLLTIPKEAIILVALPTPTAPSMAPLLSVHLFAALLLFAAAVAGARAGLRPATQPTSRDLDDSARRR